MGVERQQKKKSKRGNLILESLASVDRSILASFAGRRYHTRSGV